MRDGYHLVVTDKVSKMQKGNASQAAYEARFKVSKLDKKSEYLSFEFLKLQKDV